MPCVTSEIINDRNLELNSMLSAYLFILYSKAQSCRISWK